MRATVRTLTFLGCFGVLGCSTPADDTTELSSERIAGDLRLSLVASPNDTFRLRHALFDIATSQGSPVTQLDSEIDPDALELRAALAEGAYEITLRDGWALERLAGDSGTPTPVRGALLTQNPLGFDIQSSRVTDIVYAFSTDEGIIRFGSGEVSVSLTVVPAEALPGCDLLDPRSCAPGQTCLLANATGHTFCAEAGSLPLGSPCNAEQCVEGAQCLTLPGEAPESGVCRQFCDVSAPPSGCRCQSIGMSNVGVCTTGSDPGPIPAQCTPGVDPGPEASPWVVCAADAATAWVSADNEGFFHVDRICQSLGYSRMSQFGGTCGNVCGYCEEPTSCLSPGERFFDGEGECGIDELGQQLCFTVMWECVR